MKWYVFISAVGLLLKSLFCREFYPKDCSDPFITQNRRYYINPTGSSPFLVECKQGWTVIFSRNEKMYDFDQNQNNYAQGFGSNENFWIGLEKMRTLVESQPMMLRIEAENETFKDFFIVYESFFIDTENRKFELKVDGKLDGNLQDEFSKSHNGLKFYANNKNNKSSKNKGLNELCAETHQGGWWFKNCYTVCLTCKSVHWKYENVELTFTKSRMMLRPRYFFTPLNCHDILSKFPSSQDGVYHIYVGSSTTPTKVYCEMSKGGWTRIFNRIQRQTNDFDRNFGDYKMGFGNVNENYWLGLRFMQKLTNLKKTSLRIELFNDEFDAEFIEYDNFLIYSEANGFRLELSAKSRGTMYDWFHESHNNMTFIAKDTKLDVGLEDCAKRNAAGWWFSSVSKKFNLLPETCYDVCLTCSDSNSTHWTNEANKTNSNMKMMIKPTF